MRTVVLIAVRLVAVPLLIFIYLATTIPLVLRNFFQRVCMWCDDAFDWVARLAGWDPRFWPLPKASDDPLPELKKVPQ